MKFMRWDFGTVLKEIRQSKGLTQLEICGNNLSRATLSKIENNKEIPNVENFEYIEAVRYGLCRV